MNQEIKDRIRKFLGQHIPTEELEDDHDIFKRGLVNSLFAMQLVLFVENEFDREVPDEDLKLTNFCSVNAIASYVQ